MRLGKTLLFSALFIGLPVMAAPAHAFPGKAGIHAAGVSSPTLIQVQDEVAPEGEKAGKRHGHKGKRFMSEEMREKWESMTPEEREAFKAEKKAEMEKRWQEKLENATPEEREELLKHKAEREQRKAEWEKKREAIRQELESLPPEQREERMKELRREFKEKHGKDIETRRAKFKERWENASPEDKAAFCGKVKERCGAEDGEAPFCKMAAEKCGNQ